MILFQMFQNMIKDLGGLIQRNFTVIGVILIWISLTALTVHYSGSAYLHTDNTGEFIVRTILSGLSSMLIMMVSFLVFIFASEAYKATKSYLVGLYHRSRGE